MKKGLRPSSHNNRNVNGMREGGGGSGRREGRGNMMNSGEGGRGRGGHYHHQYQHQHHHNHHQSQQLPRQMNHASGYQHSSSINSNRPQPPHNNIKNCDFAERSDSPAQKLPSPHPPSPNHLTQQPQQSSPSHNIYQNQYGNFIFK